MVTQKNKVKNKIEDKIKDKKIPIKRKPKYAIFRERAKYLVNFCVKESNSYNFFKTVRIKPNTKKIKYDKEHVFLIDIENPTYREGSIRYYCIDVNAGQIHFKHLDEKEFMSSRINYTIFEEEIIMQLGKATTQPIESKYDWKSLIFGLVIGILGGLFGGIFIPIG